MTGNKNRFTTTEKLWSLDDETLKTPKHDEMVLWLLDESNIVSIFPELAALEFKILSEEPLTAENGFLVGYIDIVIEIPIYIDTEYTRYNYKYIEIKPTIPSFGTTLRQLKTYSHYLNNVIKYRRMRLDKVSKMYLFTTDLRFKDAFESQGIAVLTYPTE